MQSLSSLQTAAAGSVLLALFTACGSEVSSEEGPGGSSSTSTTSTSTSTSSTSGEGGSTGGAGGAQQGGGGTGGAGGASATVQCNPDSVVCDAIPPSCPTGEVPSVEGMCWGECVSILSCEPEPSCSNCQSGMCAEYVGWTTEYRCVLPTLECSALACSCLSPYFCIDPYDACSTQSSTATVTCECTSC